MHKPNQPLLSVVVPFHNSSKTIEACIESLLASAPEPESLELIFVDNNSADESRNLVNRFSSVTLLDEPTPGAYPARNRGLEAARAPIIAFTDADCTVDSAWCQVILERMKNPELGILIGAVHFPSSASLPMHLLGGWENAKAHWIADHARAQQRIAYCNNMAVRSSLFQSLGPFRNWRRAGDSEFAQRVALRRPEMTLAFDSRLCVVHHEFTRLRQRVLRLRRYQDTNQQIEGFEELSAFQRAAVLGQWLSDRKQG